MEEKQKTTEKVIETIKEPEVNEVEVTEITEVTEVTEANLTKKNRKFTEFFNNIKKGITKKIATTKHNMAVKKDIRKQFGTNASRYTVMDTVVKGLINVLLEKNETSKTLTYLGKLKLKDNTLLKDKENNIFKILIKVEGEHSRTFTAEGEEHIRELTVYSYKDV